MKWPSVSPDLPIENLWDFIDNELRKMKPTNKELEQMIQTIRDRITCLQCLLRRISSIHFSMSFLTDFIPIVNGIIHEMPLPEKKKFLIKRISTFGYHHTCAGGS